MEPSGLWIPHEVSPHQIDQFSKNTQRLQSCFTLWTNDQSVVALCPGWDDFLIWFDLQNQPARTVPVITI
ncbi:MAG TPA: hypothetical protein VFZ58_00865 [Candidatus Saccharimonadales bacterium]